MLCFRQLLKGLVVLIFLTLTFQAKAQFQDTVLVDYTSSSCLICSDPDYSCYGTDSLKFVDSTSASLRLTKLKFVFLHTPCTSSPTTLFLNGDTMGGWNNSYVCACNSCTVDSIVVTGSKLASYQQNDTNRFLYKGGSTLCIARYMIVRTWSPATDYDMESQRLVAPIYQCPGSEDIEIEIANLGLKQVDSVEVHWMYNGASQSTVKVTSTIDTLGGSGSHTRVVTLGSKTLVAGKTDTLVAWTEKPNGMTDTLPGNDTIVAHITPAFKDTLTVGGSSPDFAKIQDAFDALMSFGVCGPVVLNVRTGTYNEQLTIGNIPGVDTANTITVRSETGDSSDVSIYFSGTSSDNFVLQIMHSKHLRFRQLTMEATSSSYGRVVWFNAGNEDITFHNCRFIGPSVSSTGDGQAIFYANSSTQPTNNLQIHHCRFEKGSYGFSISNSYSDLGAGYIIEHCVFTDQYHRNLDFRNSRDIVVNFNDISRSSSASSYGHNIYIGDCSGQVRVGCNVITSLNTGTGIEIAWKSGDTSNQTHIFNNFVSVVRSTSGSCLPLRLYYANHVNVTHNSFLAECTYSSNNAVYTYYGSNINFRNNSIFNNNLGKAWHNEFSGSPNIVHSDHNNLYTLGSTFGHWNSSISDFVSWQATTGLDSNSVSVDPSYVSSTDLHSSSVELNGGADPNTDVNDDIDKEPRDSVSPDIGADEFKLPPVDAALTELKKFKSDTSCVQVVLRNLGDDTLKSVTIGWTFDGSTQTPYSWTGALESGDTAVVCVGAKIFKRDSAYNIKLWTSSPNSTTDTINGNDTISKRVFPAMCGIYTIGGTSPDYTTFNAAIDALDSAGVLDSAVFRVRDGTYSERLHITEIECVDHKNQVIFESESADSTKVTLETSSASYSSNYLIWLDGVDGITFRNMTLRNTTTYYKRVVYISNGAHYNQLSNNIIENNDSTSSSSGYALVYNETTGDHDFCLINNLLRRGSYGYYGGGSYSNPDRSTIIRGNVFENQGYEGMNNFHLRDLRLTSNHFSSMSSVYWAGVAIDECSGQNRIEKNNLIGPNLSEQYGFYLSDFDYGDTSWIINNFVSLGGTNTNCHNIFLNRFSAAMVYNNSTNLYNNDSNSSSAIWMSSGTYNCFNNNFICVNAGFGMYLNYGTISSDFNNVQTPSARFSYWSGTTYASLSAHITGTLSDSNSISQTPQYVSQTDLHITSPAMNETGMSFPFVTDDIDGEKRDSIPDIGADEFEPAKYDIGVTAFISPTDVFPADTLPIKVVVFNFGTDTIFSGIVKTRFNNDTLPDKSFSDTLASGDTLHLTVGNYGFKADTLYNILAWTTMPNSVTDQKMSNDTFKLQDKLAAMRGIYTIGGTSPDFTTFAAAIEALKVRGIVDSVKFQVANGTYTEQLRIPSIKGASAKNSIIFEGASGDSSLVKLTYASTQWDTNYTVYLNGADGISFRHLTLEATGTSYGRVVFFENGADHLCIENCLLQGVQISSSSTNYSLLYSNSTQDNGLVLRNSSLRNGSSPIYLLGNGTNRRETDVQIIGNSIEGFYAYAMYLQFQSGMRIEQNAIRNSSNSTYEALYLYYPSDSFRIQKNKIVLEKNGSGIYGYFPGNSSGDSCLITNNTISISNISSSNYGMLFNYPSGLHIAHNSINLLGASNTSFCIGVSSGGSNSTRIFNNICENQSGGYVYSFSSNVVNQCDFNNVRTTGSQFGYFGSSVVPSLSAWSASTGFDSSSTVLNPGFVSNEDLHITGVDLDGNVKRLNYVLDDIDGHPRDSMVDAGADEIRLKGLDAGIYEIRTPNSPFKSDTQYVEVILKNFGTTTLTSADINWVLNGDTGTVYNWTGSLVSKDTAWVRVEKRFFNLDSTYSLRAWTSKPNNGTDSLNTNDSLETVDEYPALSGNYTIGGASPDFVNFTEAINAMKQGGIVDSVVFTVRNGTYSEQITIPRILGADKKNSIVFQSAGSNNTTNVVLTYPSASWTNNWVIKLDSASGVCFKRITLTNPGVSYATILVMTNNSDYNEFRDCIFKGNASTNSTTSYRYLVNCQPQNGHNNDYNCFIGNEFIEGSIGVYIYGYNSSVYDRNWVFKNNQFENNYYMGIFIQYADTVLIQGNEIEHDGTYRTTSNYGFDLQYLRGGFSITSNTTRGMITRPLYMSNCSGLSSRYGLIANNMLHSSHSGSYVMSLEYGSYVNIYHNTLHASSSGANRALYSYYGSDLRLLNNILAESGSGYAWYQQGGTSIYTEIDHNDYYSMGSNLAYYNFSNQSSFSALKSATGKDTASLNVDPSFVATDDLHAREINLNEAGTPLSLVSMDIDMDTRDTVAPDIGADEFEPPAPEDAGVLAYHSPKAPFKAGSKSIEVILKNFGSDTLTSATINWTAKGTSQTSHNWTGLLLPGEVDTVTIGAYTFNRVEEYYFTFWSTVPNGVADTLNYNDTASISDIYAGLDTTYTIGSSGADFPNFFTAADVLQKAGVLDSVTFRVQSGTYNEQFRIGTFTGASSIHPVTFESMSGDSTDVVLTHNSVYDSNYIVQLVNADYLTFRGMTFKPTNYYYGNSIDISGGSQGIQIMNNHFMGYTNPYYYSSSGITSSTDNDDSCHIENNYFTQGNQAIAMNGLGSSSPEKGTIIRNNIIENGARTAIYVQNQEGLLVTGNQISLKNNSSTKKGIDVQNARDGMEISGNTITSSGLYDNGIYIDYDGSASLTGMVFNNAIALNNNSGSRYGLYASYCDYVTFAFNSVNIYGGSSSGTYALRCQYGSDIKVKNNILCNKNGGYAIYQFGSGITQSDYNDLYTTGANLAYLGGNISNLAAWQSATSKDANSLSSDPLFTSNDNLHVYISSLDSAATPISGITQDIDKDTRNTTHPDIGSDEFNSLLNNVGVSAFVKPTEGCDLDSQVVEVKIFNYGSQKQSNYAVWYSIDGGTAVKDTVTDTIGPGGTLTFSFATKHKFTSHKSYSIQAWTTLPTDQDASNDTASTTITNHSTPGAVSSMFPLDTAKNLDYPITLSWAPSSGTSEYDVYIWDDTASTRPTAPFKADLTQISTQIGSGLEYGRTFKWQVVSKNSACGTDGPIQKFTMRYLPDLIVESVSAPTTAFSGNTISVSWKIKNVGGGATGSSSWYDLVYLSTDTVYDSGDFYAGGVANASALNPSSNYSQSLSVTLPNGFTGTYYAIVRSDAYNHVIESNDGNNTGHDTSAMVVSLTPPPDLVVTSIVRPTIAFSGSTININYTIKNDGSGNTRSGYWYDHIYWSADSTFGSGAKFMKSVLRNGNLDKDSAYTKGVAINVPHFIQGKHYVYVKTDGSDREYEHTSETNNITRSDTIGVILSPPPDLVVKDVNFSDTVSTCEQVTIDYNTINQGGGHTMRGFNDVVYYSTSNVYSTSTVQTLKSHYNRSLVAGDTAKNSFAIKIPDNIVGKRYLFVVTDVYDGINENTNENNNVSAVDSFVVLAPDLTVASVRTTKMDTTGDTTLIHYAVVNQGLGIVPAKGNYDRIYISKLDTFNLDSCTQLKSSYYTSSIPAGDTLFRTGQVTIPDGFDGRRYFFVFADATQQIFENGKENNNTGRSDSVHVILAPYPDLVPQFTSVPDTANAGDLASLTYSVTNNGDTTANANWMDRVYLSKDSALEASDVLLIPILHTANLMEDSSYSNTNLVTIPATTPAGDYYYIVVADADDNVYEHSNNHNNTYISSKVYVDGYPPVDLHVTGFMAPDTLFSGKSATFNWSVKNIGQAATVADLWSDGVYLSNDSIWNAGDTLLHAEQINSTLNKDSTYTVNTTFTVPNGLSGNFYVFVRADRTDGNNDVDTSNNVEGKRSGGVLVKTTVLLTPPPDLQVSFQSVPSSGTAGQQIHVVWKVTNDGSGATTNGYWSDNVYLSTDYVVDNGDRRIGNKIHSGNLQADSMYIDSMDVFIPSSFTGNYILIVQTDAENREYEYDKEGNNTASSIVSVSKSPPADLIVSSVTATDSVVSGEQIQVSWTIENIGLNPASGYLRDNVYLSKDNKVDATDVLLATNNYNISLVKNATKNNTNTVTVSGVPLGDYYIVVSTDVLNNINEANDTNNIGLSASMNIDIPELVLGKTKSDTLFDLKEKMYRIHISDTLRGESMLVTLKGDSANGNNEMYIRKGEVPTRSEFDFGYSDPFQGNQEIIVPELDSGTYYLMVHGESDVNSYQNIDLLAKILEFEIRKVTPSKGGNTGQVTLKIEGSKFTDKTLFFIGNDSTRISKTTDTLGRRYSQVGEVETDTFLLIDPTTVYVVFELNGMSPGLYDVIAEKGDTAIETATLENGFEVEKGVPADIQLNVTRPANARTNRIVSFSVDFTNNGNTDIVGGQLELISNGTTPISLTLDGLSDNKTSIMIPLEENEGIPDRLRPGASGSVKVYSKASNTLGFSIVLPE